MNPTLLFAFLEEAQKGNLSEDDKEAVDVAAQCLCRVYGVDQVSAQSHVCKNLLLSYDVAPIVTNHSYTSHNHLLTHTSSSQPPLSINCQ